MWAQYEILPFLVATLNQLQEIGEINFNYVFSLTSHTHLNMESSI